MNYCTFEIIDAAPQCIVCGFRLPPSLPTNTIRKCTDRGVKRQTLLQIIDTCPHRGEYTGREVTCGCASMPKQPVFLCTLHGEAIRHKTSRTDYAGIACIECDYPREQIQKNA